MSLNLAAYCRRCNAMLKQVVIELPRNLIQLLEKGQQTDFVFIPPIIKFTFIPSLCCNYLQQLIRVYQQIISNSTLHIFLVCTRMKVSWWIKIQLTKEVALPTAMQIKVTEALFKALVQIYLVLQTFSISPSFN